MHWDIFIGNWTTGWDFVSLLGSLNWKWMSLIIQLPVTMTTVQHDSSPMCRCVFSHRNASVSLLWSLGLLLLLLLRSSRVFAAAVAWWEAAITPASCLTWRETTDRQESGNTRHPSIYSLEMVLSCGGKKSTLREQFITNYWQKINRFCFISYVHDRINKQVSL